MSSQDVGGVGVGAERDDDLTGNDGLHALAGDGDGRSR
jgi:hypothetical protein